MTLKTLKDQTNQDEHKETNNTDNNCHCTIRL